MFKLMRYGILVLLSVSSCMAFAKNKTTEKPLEVGIVPYLSARALISTYEPFRQYLEKELGRPVNIYTANGFRQYMINAQNGAYDLVITAAHFARLLQTEQQFTPLVRFAGGNRCLVMTALDSPIKSLSDLHGKTIALPDRLSLASIGCLTYLREHGLNPGTDFQIMEVPTFASAILALQKGEANAAVSAPAALAQMPAELRESVRVVIKTDELFNLVFLANPRLGKKATEQLYTVLEKFEEESSECKLFLRNTGFLGLIPVTASDMSTLDRYADETKRLLTTQNLPQ